MTSIKKTDNCVIDSNTMTIRCKKCGDEIPIPIGAIPWVVSVMKAFSAAHAGHHYRPGQTGFTVPPAG